MIALTHIQTILPIILIQRTKAYVRRAQNLANNFRSTAVVMHSVQAITVLIAVINTPVLSMENKVLRVYNGDDDLASKYPYVVCLMFRFTNIRLCSGTLVTSNWVLTAGHCLQKDLKFIQYGNMSLTLNHTDTKREVLKMLPHPRHILYEATNDVGLLQVDPIPMDEYGSLSAVDYATLMGLHVEYAGYGSTFIPKRNIQNKRIRYLQDLSRPLRLGEGVITSCEPVAKKFICVSPKCIRRQSTLGGDSGGPLFFERKIVGIVCGGPLETYTANSDRYFTPISSRLTWIMKVVSSTSD